jgi:uncharacterized membrane protein YbhN (UPF0104 family)
MKTHMDSTRLREAQARLTRCVRRPLWRFRVADGATRMFWPLRWLLSISVPCGALGILVYLIATRGDSFVTAFGAVPPWVIAAAVGAHLVTLALRTEAWGTVLRAAGSERLEPRALHAANAGAFVAGTLQGQAAVPTRVALLRRFGGSESRPVAQVALCDAPIVMFEVCGSAILAAFGSTAVGVVPAWTPWAMLAGSLAILMALRLVYGRFRDRQIAGGLAVLANPRLCTRLALIVAAFTLMAFLRTLIVMYGFGLPTDPAHVCLVLFTMGAVGLLPLGVGTGPAAMVAALGATGVVTATAAGMVVSAATMIAVLIYACAVWAWRVVAERPELEVAAMA